MFSLANEVAAESGSWSLGWDALVAIGTLLLAAFTAGLAFSTRGLAIETKNEIESAGLHLKESRNQTQAALRQAESVEAQAGAAQTALAETQAQTALSRELFARQDRPLLLDVPTVLAADRLKGVFNDAGELHPDALTVNRSPGLRNVLVSFRNVGTGVARLKRCDFGDVDGFSKDLSFSWITLYVAPGEVGRGVIEVPDGHPFAQRLSSNLEAKTPIIAAVRYSDLSGTYEAVLTLVLRDGGSGDGAILRLLSAEHLVVDMAAVAAAQQPSPAA